MMKVFIQDFFNFIKNHKKVVCITIIVIFIFNLCNPVWFESVEPEQSFNFQFYTVRLLIYFIILFFVLLTIFLKNENQTDGMDLIFIFLNGIFQLGFNVYLILTIPSQVLKGYDMGIVSIPFYSVLGTIFATFVFFITYIVVSIFKQKRIIKISVSFLLSFIVTYIYMKYFICNDNYYF